MNDHPEGDPHDYWEARDRLWEGEKPMGCARALLVLLAFVALGWVLADMVLRSVRWGAAHSSIDPMAIVAILLFVAVTAAWAWALLRGWGGEG